MTRFPLFLLLGGALLLAVGGLSGLFGVMPKSAAVDAGVRGVESEIKAYRERCVPNLNDLKKTLDETSRRLLGRAGWSRFAPTFAQAVPDLECVVYLMESDTGYRLWRSDAYFRESWADEAGPLRVWLSSQRDKAWKKVLIMGGSSERVVTFYAWLVVPVDDGLDADRWAGLEHTVKWPLKRSSRSADTRLHMRLERLRHAQMTQAEDAQLYRYSALSAGAVLLLLAVWSWWRLRRPKIRIFISYRREGNRGLVDRMKDVIEREFGADNVFRDEKMDKGVPNFQQFLETEVERSDVVVWCIAPGCRVDLSEGGTDFMLHELRHARGTGRKILPVRLTDEAPAPNEVGLPRELEAITLVNSPRLRNDPEFADDMVELLKAITKLSDASLENV